MRLSSLDLSNCTNLESIGNYAFYYCYGLTSLDLSECTSLESIGNYAFHYCYSLTSSLDLSECTSLESIGNYAFYYCYGLTSLDLSNCTNLTTIGSSAFCDCYGLTSLDLSGCTGLESIGSYAFAYCKGLTGLDLSDCMNIEEIGNCSFRNCYVMTSIDLSDCNSLTRIGRYAFYYCYGLTEINLSNCTELEIIDTYTFYYCYGLTNIDLSYTKIEKLEKNVFALCTGLEEITLPSSLTDIGSEAFYICVKLESINLDECTQLTSIGQYAFYLCENLKNIEFPDSLYQIHNFAFYYTQLEEIDLSNCSDLSYIGTYAFWRSYDNYSENVNIYLPENTNITIGYAGLYQNRIDLGWYGIWSGIYYIDNSGIGYYYSSSDDTNYAYLAFVPSGLENIEIPSSITVDEVEYSVTGMECFSLQYASDLEEITFEDSSIITYLEAYSFAYCENLTTVGGYSTSDEIMENVFYNVSTDYEYTLFECTNIDTTYNFIVWVDFDYYGYFTYEDEIDDVSEITLELYCDGEVIEEAILARDEIDNQTYIFFNLEAGHEYYVDVKHNLDGWGANIRYYYAGDSTLTYEWINIERIYAYTVNIDWNDEESTGEKPSEVEVVLYDGDGNEYATAILNEENNWSYTFYVNTFSAVDTIDYSYEAVEYAVSVVTEDNIIESNIVSYDITYDDAVEVTARLWSQHSSNTWTNYPGYLNYHVSSDCNTWRTSYYTTASYYPGATISLTYTQIEPVVESTITKTGDTEISDTEISDTEEQVSYDITYTATIDDYKGDVTLILTDTLPYAIDEEQSDLDGGTYNSEDKTITWEEDIDTINTYSTDEAYEIEITKSIAVLYTDIDLTQESLTNNVQATITLLNVSSSSSSETTQTVEDDSETQINVTTDVTVSKVWEDDDDQDGIRPESIEVQLYADGESLGEDYLITLNDENNWIYTWSGLSVYESGEEITYTVEEATDLTELGYTAEISGSASEGYTITNSYTPETKDITVNKVWEDDDNQDGIRPESIEVNLLVDGSVTDTVTLNDENSWTYTWSDMQAYDDGTEIEYTVVEVEVPDGYTSVITEDDGTYTITNSYTTETTNITVNKIWDDSTIDSLYRPESIVIILYANGEEIDRVTLEEPEETSYTWEYTFENLAVYEDGELIEYTVGEEEVTEGDLDYYSSAISGYNITNTYIGPIISQEKTIVTENENDYVIAGETITYSISVKNIGQTAIDVIVLDTIPDGTTFVDGSIQIDESSEYGDEDLTSKTDEDLVSGITITVDAETIVTLSFQVTVDDDASGDITNIAFVEDNSEKDDEDKYTNEVTVTVEEEEEEETNTTTTETTNTTTSTTSTTTNDTTTATSTLPYTGKNIIKMLIIILGFAVVIIFTRKKLHDYKDVK